MLSAMTTVAVVTNDKITATVAAVVIAVIKAIAAMMANVIAAINAASLTVGAAAAIRHRRKRARHSVRRKTTTPVCWAATINVAAIAQPTRANRAAATTARVAVAIGTVAVPMAANRRQS
jgi:hypothetical protein